jgi:cytochrome c oxidase subunit 2
VNETQVIIAVGYGVLFLASFPFLIKVIRSTRRRARGDFDVELTKKQESRFAVVIAALLAGLFVITAFFIPYGDTSTSGGQVVQVRGFQFGWTVDPPTVDADQPVEFRVRSSDVQHGFGLYRGTELLAQVQVPAVRPGSDSMLSDEQRLVYTFREAGTYELLCLEFCGEKHHMMHATIEVQE